MKQNYNNESLARLGHGKWKSALGHTLLIIGMVLMSLGVYAQTQTNPEMTMPKGLKMEKKWQSDDPTNRTGNILVEAFVTGHAVSTHVPTDIVLVLDVSGSMEDAIGGTALPSQSYSYNSYGESELYYYYQNEYFRVHRGTSGNYYTNYYLRFLPNDGQWRYLSGNGITTSQPTMYYPDRTIYTGVLYEGTSKMDALKTSVKLFVDIINTDATNYNVDHCISIVKYASNTYYPNNSTGESRLTEGNNRGAGGNANSNYTEVLINRRDPRTDATYIKNQVDALQEGGATAADYGMQKAKYLLASIPSSEFESRNKVVVMFTDGAPTHGSSFSNTVANTTISNSRVLKNSGTVSGTNYNFNATVFSVGVFANKTDDIDTYMNYVSSNYPQAQSMTNGGTKASEDYFFEASSAGGLNDIFEKIAGASGAIALPAGTIVQDVVSPSFHLPTGSNAAQVTAYAPKCTGYDEDNDEYTFEDLSDAAELIIGQIADPQNPGQYITGVVTNDPEEGNKIGNEGFVDVDGNTINIDNFNFTYHWCGYEDDEIHGRKIVIKIPVVVEEGVWGDGIITNDPDNSWIYNPTTGEYYGPFNNLTTNVQSDVWTEVVRTKPNTFVVPTDDSPIEIGTPEDLAWFISYVNGRLDYEAPYNTQQPNWSANAILTADIDMSAHNWVPIGGGSGHGVGGYTGTFDGNGHVITGLKNNASKYFMLVPEGALHGVAVVYPGMFSKVGANGVVKNVFVLDADFRGKHHTADFVHHGIIADTLLSGGQIFNCEAAGRLTCNNDEPEEDQNLIYGGLVGLNQGTIHSCMAMVELTGYTMGGMIGENGHTVNGTTTNGTFTNGFTNGVYNYIGTNQNSPVGGIAGINNQGSSISNCYVRFSRESSGLDNTTAFHQVVGNGNYTVASCYTPSNAEVEQEILTTNTAWNNTVPATGASATACYTNTRNQSRMRQDRSNDNMVGGTWLIKGEGQSWQYSVLDGGTPLLTKLNQGAGSYTPWKRTTAIGTNYTECTSPNGGNINSDYPVLAFADFNCVASADGIRLDYATSLDEMLERHNNGNMNANTILPAEGSGYVQNDPQNPYEYDYTVSQAKAIYGGAINLYANDDNVTKSTSTTAKTMVYINENVSLLQGDNSNIDAYTGQTIKDFGSTYDEDGNRWHNVSSSLSNSQFGWDYFVTEQVPHAWGPNWASWAANHAGADPQNPCLINLHTDDDDQALFPSDARSFNVMDFYCFYEPKYHWINFKRNSNSHWHMDAGYTTPLVYNNGYTGNNNEFTGEGNETQFIPGKGYLLALYTEYFDDMHLWAEVGQNDDSKHKQFIQNRGTLNNGNVDIPVTYTTDAIIDLDGYKTGLEGYNLLGNPYQSYLDFDEFVAGNNGLWANGDTYAKTYAVYDPSANNNKGAWLQYGENASTGAMVASKFINMHQGFFIQTTKTTNDDETNEAHFTNAMRSNEGTPNFRGEQPTYPLINFIVTDNEGNTDVAVLELNRSENDGAKKLRMGSPAGRIYFRYDNTNMAIFFRDNAEGHQTLNFSAEEDGNFTLNWNTANADFSSLTLVDNITGIKTDMLTHDHYTFEGRVDDYNTRFKIVFGEMDNNEEEPVLEHFAFFDHGNLIVNGTGHFEVVDVLGRVVYATELTDTQNTVSLPSNVRGVCMLCFTRNNETKVQKMVIQ